MARGRKNVSEKADGVVERPVHKEQLVALVKESYATKERTASIAGAFGERVKNAVENGRLNKKAFSFVCALHRMEELKRQAVIRDVQLYIDMIEESGLWGHQHVGNMVDDMESEGANSSSEEEKIAAQNAEALRGLARLSDEEFEKDMGRAPKQDAGPESPLSDEGDPLEIPAVLDRRKKAPALAVVQGDPVH